MHTDIEISVGDAFSVDAGVIDRTSDKKITLTASVARSLHRKIVLFNSLPLTRPAVFRVAIQLIKTRAFRASRFALGAVALICSCLIGSLAPLNVRAQNADTCTENSGGTAYCVGPEVGPFRYQVSDAPA